MTTQDPSTSRNTHGWDGERLRLALSASRYHAARGARRLGLSRQDQEDLSQDILLAMVLRGAQFDPSRGAWSTFVGLLARNVVAERVRVAREARLPTFVEIEVDDFALGCSATQQDDCDPDLSLDLERATDELPAGPRAVPKLICTKGDMPSAQRASSLSCPSFYRAVADLRCWLLAMGLQPAPAAHHAAS